MNASRMTGKGLEPYVPSADMPWNYQRAAHLLRRSQMGAPRHKVLELLSLTPTQAVNQLVSETLAQPAFEYPVMAPDEDNPDRRITERWIAFLMRAGMREKMALFWSNLLIASLNGYNEAYYFDYLSLLRDNALGNYKTLVTELGLNTAMIEYLDMDGSHKDGPNENYARELLELFTMSPLNKDGQPNYSEIDIQEIARAFTGWRRTDGVVGFTASRFDDGEKTVFGQTGNWGYHDILDIIFSERTAEIAGYVCGKLYEFFVYETPEQSVVDDMALTFIQSNFDIIPVLQQLFTSTHFYESNIIGAKIKSPSEAVLGFMNEIGRGFTEEGEAEQLNTTRNRIQYLGQPLGMPPDVFGWPEHDAWISVQSLPSRWDTSAGIVYANDGFPDFDPIPLARSIDDHNDPYALVDGLVETVLAVGPGEYSNEQLTEILLDGIPTYEWNIEIDEATSRLQAFLAFLTNLPEHQLI
ncbi:MAG: DUF1800 family protein [Bacteroidota bacterium]